MPFSTARLGLPFIDAGQAQKELTHNEALVRLDQLVQAVVVEVGRNVPPAEPAPGNAWIVGPDPSGDWAGQASAIASCSEAGWRFTAPVEGLRVWSRADAVEARYADGAWLLGDARARRVTVNGQVVVRERQPAIEQPSGGTVVDAEARLGIAAILGSLREHGLIDG